MEIAGVEPSGAGRSRGKARAAGLVGVGALSLIGVWFLLGGRFVGSVHEQPDPAGACSLAVSPDGELLAVGYNTGRLDVHDAGSGAWLRTLDPGGSTITNWLAALAFNRDGSILASGNWNKQLRFWNPRTGKPAKPPVEHSYRVSALAWDPSDRTGHRLAFGGAGVHVVDADSGEVRALEGGGMVRALGYTPDGQALASIGERSLGVLWDPEAGDELRRLEGGPDHDNQSVTLAVSPVGEQIATAVGPGVELWDSSTGSLLRTLPGHPGASGLQCLAYSPDGRLLASSGDRKARGVKLWDSRSGTLIAELQAPDDDGKPSVVWALAFTPDGRLIGGHRNGFTAWTY